MSAADDEIFRSPKPFNLSNFLLQPRNMSNISPSNVFFGAAA
jgi:hypothetical protein